MNKFYTVSLTFKNHLPLFYNEKGEEMIEQDFNTQLTFDEALKVFEVLKNQSNNWMDFEIEIVETILDENEEDEDDFDISTKSVKYFSDYRKSSKIVEY